MFFVQKYTFSCCRYGVPRITRTCKSYTDINVWFFLYFWYISSVKIFICDHVSNLNCTVLLLVFRFTYISSVLFSLEIDPIKNILFVRLANVYLRLDLGMKRLSLKYCCKVIFPVILDTSFPKCWTISSTLIFSTFTTCK